MLGETQKQFSLTRAALSTGGRAKSKSVNAAGSDEKRPRPARVDRQMPSSAMFTDQAWKHMGRRLGLSGRELHIVRGVFDDRIESAIAADLGMSPHTVHTHFDRLHRKLGVVNRPQLILRVVQSFLAL